MTVSETDKLVQDNMGLVNMVVRRYVGYGTDYDDLFQIGAIGLVKAAQKFDASKNFKFSTYAVSKIVGELKTYFRDSGSIKISRSIKENKLKIQKATDLLTDKLGRAPSIGEISEMCGLDREQIVECLEVQDTVLSLDKEMEQGGELYDVLGENHEEHDLIRITLSEALEKLSAKERKLIVLRYFLDKTQSEVAEILQTSQVSVSRQEKNILKKLNKMIS